MDRTGGDRVPPPPPGGPLPGHGPGEAQLVIMEFQRRSSLGPRSRRGQESSGRRHCPGWCRPSPGQCVVGRHGHQADDRLGGIAMAPGRGHQAVADLDTAVIGLALEAQSSDGPPIGQAGDPVVAERLLLPACRRGPEEPADGTDVTLEGESSAQVSAGPAARRATMRSASATSIGWS